MPAAVFPLSSTSLKNTLYWLCVGKWKLLAVSDLSHTRHHLLNSTLLFFMKLPSRGSENVKNKKLLHENIINHKVPRDFQLTILQQCDKKQISGDFPNKTSFSLGSCSKAGNAKPDIDMNLSESIV